MIRARQLTRKCGSAPALTNITLDVNRGECVVLAGPAGGGRTTLLRILGTLIPPTEGTAEIDGLDVVKHRERVRERTLYVDGWIAAADGLRVGEYLQFVAGSRTRGGLNGAVIASVAKRVRLDEAARVDRLDLDGRARLALACGLATPVDALLLDEPLRQVDAAARPVFVEWIHERCTGGTAVLAACGDETDGVVPADRMLTMDNGRIVPVLRVAAGAR